MKFTVPASARWLKDSTGQFWNYEGVRWFEDGDSPDTIRTFLPEDRRAIMVPSRRTEAIVCEKHRQMIVHRGKVITTTRKFLVIVEVAPCTICPSVDRWNRRIAAWRATVGDEAFRASVLPWCFDRAQSIPHITPAEWAMGVGDWFHLPAFPWDHAEMRRFLEGERSEPPQSNLARLLDKEREARGPQAARDAAMAMGALMSRFYDRDE